MLQKTYSIYSEDLADVQLFVEAGKNHIACWCKKDNDAKLKAFEFFQCDDYTAENFEALIDNVRLYSRLLTMPVNTTNFYWNTDETLCLPGAKNNEDFIKANFELMFGETYRKQIFSVPTDECLVAWSIEHNQQNVAQESFRGAVFTHQYKPLFASLQAKEDAMHLFFYPYYFTLIVMKDGKLLFAQTRKYSIAADVLYFVLNTCKQYNIDKNIPVLCGGFIDENSKLYETLFQYLEGLQLTNIEESLFEGDEFKEYSSHYFMPYINYVV